MVKKVKKFEKLVEDYGQGNYVYFCAISAGGIFGKTLALSKEQWIEIGKTMGWRL